MTVLDQISAGPAVVPQTPLLAVRNLSVSYVTKGKSQTAVHDVSFDVHQGEVVALVGESGSGKSTIALAAMGMLPPSARLSGGSLTLGTQRLSNLSEHMFDGIRGREIGWVPQDPMIALNPVHRVGRQVGEPLRIHGLATSKTIGARVEALLERVRINNPTLRATQFPHELSGGMRQRVLIAAALGPEPRLIIADEPTTALDVTVQKTILDDIGALIASSGTSMLLITHDLAVAAERADRIIVLKGGRIVEEGASRDVLQNPSHEYTRLLLASAPGLSRRHHRSAPVSAQTDVILSLEDVSKSFSVRDGGGGSHIIKAVEHVSLRIERGRTLAVVGESGSGKSTAARIALGLTQPEGGRALFEGVPIDTLDREGFRRMRRLVQPIYQNPYASLDPRFTVSRIIAEPLQGFRIVPRQDRRRRVLELMEQVGLPPSFAERYPAELSGGQRQRVAIARALAPEPALLVCDEPVSALDVSIQAQILDLLALLQETHGLSYLFISHDLAVVRQVADDIAVMKDGRIVEAGPAGTIFSAPSHPYTKVLFASIPGASTGTLPRS